VDRLERDLQGQAQVIRLNILTREGRAAIGLYGVRAVPTLLIFDGCGDVVERQVGFLNYTNAFDAVETAVPGCES
jgi:hypothetical protein